MVKGRLDATTEEQATELLGYAGYQVVNLKQLAHFRYLEKLKLRLFQVQPTDVILLFQQIALLLETGMSITSVLEILEEQASNRTLKKVMAKVIADLRGGAPLSVALSKHPSIFSPIHCQSLKVGEESGNLEVMLREVADYMERQVKTSKGVKNALSYPVFAFLITIAVVAVLVTLVLPAFSKLYASLGAELPALTRFVIAAGDSLKAYGIYLIGALGVAAALAYAYIKTPAGKYRWDTLSLRFPMVGRINHLNHLARVSRSISLLFHAGLPLTEILPLVTESTGNVIIADALSETRKNMISGEGLSRPMAKNKVFLSMMVQMVKVGEETGNLDSTLLSVAKSYETEAEDKTRSLIGMIQPAMIIVIGMIVGLLAISLVSAMYSIYSQLL